MRARFVALSVILIAFAIAVGVAWHSRRSAPVDPWRAPVETLLGRVERLSAGGDTAAAGKVMQELERRGDPALVDRGRMALARGLLAAGSNSEALARVGQISWADKGPAVASEIVGLDLRIRWQLLLDADGSLPSGILDPRDVADSERGSAGGAYAGRREAFAGIEALLASGARLVEREGGRVPLPVPAGQLTLARYAHGALTWPQAAAQLGATAEWADDTALSALRLHLSEHEIDLAAIAAATLWDRQPRPPAAAQAFAELQHWHLRRARLAPRLALWPYPALEARLAAQATAEPVVAAEVQRRVDAEDDTNDAALAESMRQAMSQVEPLDVVSEGPPNPRAHTGEREWQLALTYDGLALTPVQEVTPAGEAVRLSITSSCHPPYRVALWRIADDAAWDRLRAAPQRADLPSEPVWSAAFDTLAPDGVSAPGLPEGRYVASLTARGSPVVVLRSLRVASAALHVVAGHDACVLWAVERANGQGQVGAPLALRLTLVRNAGRAAGSTWESAAPAWRSGFSEGFTGTPDLAWRSTGVETDFAAGKTAGLAAALADPAQEVELTASAGPGGVWLARLPPAFVGRAYTANARIDRAGAYERCTAEWGSEAHWTAKAVCWADKPLVRPGEMLRFAGVLREFDGEAFRLVARTLPAQLLVGGEAVWSGDLTLDPRGMLAGEALVPPGAIEGAVRLVLDGQAGHDLGRCERLALPPLRLTVDDDGGSARAGEPRLLRVRLTDQAGEPIAGAFVSSEVSAFAQGESVPCEVRAAVATDLAGQAQVSIATAAGVEATYRVRLVVERDGRNFWINHSWTTSAFAFPLTVELPDPAVDAGSTLHVRLTLPAKAQVSLSLQRDGSALGGARMMVTGGADGHAEVHLPLVDSDAGADRLRVAATVLGGGEAVRLLAIQVRERPAPGQGASVRCSIERARVRPGEELAVVLGCNAPGRDMLLLAGARGVLMARPERLDESAKRVICTPEPEWGPACELQAMTWLPGRGFTASARQRLEVLPVDRLLAVEVRCSADAYRPGDPVEAVVSVRDWRGAAVAGAGITLGVVDDRLYQLAEDPTPDLWRFFHQYPRSWELIEASGESAGVVAGLLWRSVTWRWQGSEFSMAGRRSGGAKKRALGRFGGSKGSENGSELRQLGSELDPCIHWVAGLTTGNDGTAALRFVLPASAASFRLTARVADGSARLLVGEVRRTLAARQPLGLRIQAPAVARPGDRIAVQVEVVNHTDVPTRVRLRLAESDQAVELAPRARRSIAVPVTVSPAPVDAPLRVVGDLIGRLATLRVEAIEAGGASITAETAWLVAAAGLPQRASLRLVAAPDGSLPLPFSVPIGAAVALTARAWPDAAARRRDELAKWRAGDGVRAAIAWLDAPAGDQRRRRLAELWPKLGQDPAAQMVRVAAARLGVAAGGMDELPPGLLGDWLLARGRAAGLPLPAPRLRGSAGRTRVERACAAACAQAEAWGEAGATWRALRDELLNATLGDDDSLAVAVALDAARLAGDDAASARLAAILAQLPWSEDLVAVLAAELLPTHGNASAAPLTVRGGAVPATMDAAAGAQWSGQLSEPLALRAPPGALVALELHWLASMPMAPAHALLPVLELWQLDQDGYRLVAPGEPVWPGRPLLLVVDGRERAAAKLTVLLPALLRPAAAVPAALLVDGIDWRYPLTDAAASTVHLALTVWRSALPGDGQRLDLAVLGAFDQALRDLQPVRQPHGIRLDALGLATSDAAGALTLDADGGRIAVALAVQAEGQATWPGALVAVPDGRTWALPERTLQVAIGRTQAEVAPLPGHPLRAELMACAQRITAEELDWLVGQLDDDPARWASALATLDPTASHTLDQLLEHPGRTRPEHWTVLALRRWLDAEPAFDSGVPPDEVAGPTSLAAMVELAARSREDRLRAWRVLPPPQALPRRAPATVRAWCERVAASTGFRDFAVSDWLWTQDLDPALLTQLGYAASLDGWATFCRHELGLSVRIGGGIPARRFAQSEGTVGGERRALLSEELLPEPMLGGGGLGTAHLTASGLVVVRLDDGTCELRPAAPRAGNTAVQLSVNWDDVPVMTALAELNEMLVNRGLPRLELVAPGADLPVITMSVQAGDWRMVADYLARQSGLHRQGTKLVAPP